MVFVNGQFANHLWKLKMDLNKGKVAGEMAPLPHYGGSQLMPSSSADGRLLAYAQVEPGGVSVRLRDLATSKETALVNSLARPKVSPDVSQIAYSAFPNSMYVMPSAGGEATRLVTPGEQVTQRQIREWTADGTRIVYWYGNPARFALLDPETRGSTDLIAHPKMDIYTAEMSPDQRWVAFATQVGAQWNLWIAACPNGKAVGEKDWILVNTGSDQRPWWSPDGNLLYTVSSRDGVRCIWAQRLNPTTKRPQGQPFAVHHLHGARVKVASDLLAGFGPAILPDGLIFSLNDLSANVWIGEPQK
jgi:dipeptidyl aminopeptidase/acylaminoacyl peptidase